MESLKGKVALVVGGSSGIGLGIGMALAREAAKVVLVARTEAKLKAVQQQAGHEIGFHVKSCDVTHRQDFQSTVDWVQETLGPVEILVYSAGMNVPKRTFAEMDPECMDQVMDVNAIGAYNSMRAVLPSMRERRQGLIINVVSLAGLRAMQLAGLPYCASKFAQSAIGTYANLEALPDGVRVTNIYPGETETPILDQRPIPPSAEQRACMLQPDDIAEMVLTIAKLPSRATVPELVITPRHMPYV
ncbi:MAG: SDR family NAD(P)-dependent oxidoreductase [Verrucomicrobiota bacterium]|nr:SDR family NAD(P)-dependent oxidoreductase [Verrucomicrobiota bacterium]